MPAYFAKAAAGGSYTLQTTQTGTENNQEAIGDSSARKYAAGDYPAGSNVAIRRIVVRLKQQGTFAGSLTFQLWTTSVGVPTTQIGSDSTTVITALTGSYVDYTIDFPSDMAQVSGTYYAVVGFTAAVDGSNYVLWVGTTDGTNVTYKGATAPPTVFDGGISLAIKTYSFA